MLIQLIAVLIYLVKAANYFAKDYPKISILAKCSAIFGSFSLLGVIVTPADVPSLYTLHIFFANSVFNGAFVTLGIYSYLFYSKGLKNVTYTLFLCSLVTVSYTHLRAHET